LCSRSTLDLRAGDRPSSAFFCEKTDRREEDQKEKEILLRLHSYSIAGLYAHLLTLSMHANRARTNVRLQFRCHFYDARVAFDLYYRHPVLDAYYTPILDAYVFDHSITTCYTTDDVRNRTFRRQSVFGMPESASREGAQPLKSLVSHGLPSFDENPTGIQGRRIFRGLFDKITTNAISRPH
jgi:hypothetical protein